jgi:predicted NAD/FAD-dependent oxidoreductase
MDLDPIGLPVDVSDSAGCPGMYVCGDHRETPSIQGAMNSGLRVAAAIHSRG